MGYSNYVLMSIKPVFAEEILTGFKKFELRSRTASIASGDKVIMYASTPIKSLVGMFTAGRILTLTYEELNRMYRQNQLPGVTERDLEFMRGRKRPLLAIEVLDPIRFNEPIRLSEIKQWIPGFRPPMNYVRLKADDPLLALVLKKLRAQAVR